MLCTTNCSWGLTRVMVERLVESAGARGPGGARAFPTAEALARKPVSFFRDVVRAGYRAPYFKELATRVARGDARARGAARSGAPVGRRVYERLRSITGIGPYAADNLMRLLGHYDRLGLDSWCRARFLKLYPRTRKAGLDAAIARRYRPYAPYSGLAMWLDLTRTLARAGRAADLRAVTSSRRGWPYNGRAARPPFRGPDQSASAASAAPVSAASVPVSASAPAIPASPMLAPAKTTRRRRRSGGGEARARRRGEGEVPREDGAVLRGDLDVTEAGLARTERGRVDLNLDLAVALRRLTARLHRRASTRRRGAGAVTSIEEISAVPPEGPPGRPTPGGDVGSEERPAKRSSPTPTSASPSSRESAAGREARQGAL